MSKPLSPHVPLDAAPSHDARFSAIREAARSKGKRMDEAPAELDEIMRTILKAPPKDKPAEKPKATGKGPKRK